MKILIGIPTRGKVQIGTILFLKNQAYPFIMSSSNISIQTARLEICSYFLKGDWSHLFFMDDDILCPDGTIEKLISYDKEIVSINCPIYLNGSIYSSAKADKLYRSHFFDETGFKEVYSCGLGACLIKREVIEKVFINSNPNEIFQVQYTNDGRIAISEDISFCELLHQLNISIYYDFDLKCDHLKIVSLKQIYDSFVLTKEINV